MAIAECVADDDQNLEQFNDDLTLQLRNSLSTYVDIVHATAATNMQATEVARVIVSKVDAERDSTLELKSSHRGCTTVI